MTAEQRPPAGGRAGRVLRYLPGVTLLAVVTVTSTSEWTLARTVLDLPPAVAWAVPVAIDSYVVAALRTRRDVPAAIAVMAGALAAAMGAHLAAASRPHGQPLPTEVTAPAAAAIMSVLVVVAWRVHVLIDHLAEHHDDGDRVSATAPTSTPEASTPQPSPTAALPVSTAVPTSTDAPPQASTGGGAVTPRRPEYATSRVPAPAPSTAADTGQRPELTDDEIVRDVQATGDGTSPGIRALKRSYAIGQTRAARIHQQISTPKTQQQQQNSDQKKAEEAISSSDEESTQEPTRTSPQTDPSSDIQIYRQETHKGITDRVGRPRSTEELAAPPFPALFRAGGEG